MIVINLFGLGYIEPRLLFRDVLRANAQIRTDYEKLKKSLFELYPLDREAYTENKTDFIRKVLNAQGYFKDIKP
jgi:GrpB-like predicted nucleotidyltransferase (UPF0157 family)